MKKPKKKPESFNVICKTAGRNISRKEAREMANRGFEKDYQDPWTEKVGYSEKYAEGWERIWGKKKKRKTA